MKQSENCKRPPAPLPPLLHGELTFSISIIARMLLISLHLIILPLALMPKSAYNKSWRYIKGARYMYSACIFILVGSYSE